ncbi:hypothetical protein MA16_Dca001675 [Dendrobium catenatum]|uniref:Uncharacterized protein n=1 Tax=Dendrobium catenatum TaxID=906689 RepID=A0A2I0WN32_9ASPA|nr:hypothetical protein MA16_Dca001675 [Dendrobium catenatum]
MYKAANNSIQNMLQYATGSATLIRADKRRPQDYNVVLPDSQLLCERIEGVS